MKYLIAFFLFLTPTLLQAQTLNIRPTHPISLQHQLPTGEAPGWLKNNWIDTEVTNGNHWGEPTSYTDLRNNNNLIWDSDFEQTTLWLEIGRAFSKRIALALEAPYVFRHEGETSDHFIDEFHHIFGFARFGRQRHDEGRVVNETRVITPSNETTTKRAKDSGIGSFKLKIKYWFVKWARDTGLGLSLHTKFPMDNKKQGMGTGAFDYSALLHIAVPFGDQGGVYITSGATYASENYLFKEWPRNKVLWMTDAHINIGLTENWSLAFNTSFHAPFMDKDKLRYEENLPTQEGDQPKSERGSSNYNSLALERGHQMLGLKRHFGEESYWMIYFVEDWGFGNKAQTGDYVYSNNQPDIAAGLKSVFYF